MLLRSIGHRPGLKRCLSIGVIGTILVVAAAATGSAQTTGPVPPTVAPAAAEEQAQPDVIVTGSRIPRPNLTAASPVSVVTAQDVKLQGAVLTETLINVLPQAKPDQGLFLSNGETGTATVDLRGLGASRTLVLINGRRLLPGDASYSAADINFVPSALISRVEVLTGGASSVYGSDAVAGVVNFILDTHVDGFRFDGQASTYQHDNRDGADLHDILDDGGVAYPRGDRADGAIFDANAAYGFNLADGRVHATVYGGYRRARSVTQDARDYSACTVTTDASDEPPRCGGSTTAALGIFVIPSYGDYYTPTADRRFEPRFTLFNYGPYNYWQRPDRRYTAGGFVDAEVSRAVKPYLEVMFMDDRTTAQVAPSGDFGNTTTINCDNPLLSASQRSLVCFNGNFVGQRSIFDDDGNLVGITGTPTPFTDPSTGQTYYRAGLRILRRNVEGGARQEVISHRDFRIVAGVKGDLGRGISYDASYLGARVSQRLLHTDDLLVSRLTSALDVVTDPASGRPVCRSALSGAEPDCLPWDVFAVGAVTAEAAASLAVPSTLTGKVSERVANASVTADLGNFGIVSPWADQSPALNVGAEYRRDRLSLDPDEHFRNADLVGLATPVLPLSGTVSVKELFGELRVPVLSGRLIDELVLEGGYRRSWYRNAQSRSTGSSYKLAAELSPLHGVRFRASQQRAIRAPNVQELFALTYQDNFPTDPCAGFAPAATLEQCQRSGVTAAQYGQIERQTDADQRYNGIGGGNPDLHPETATTRTVGVVIRPAAMPRLTLTADWFDIQVKGAVAVIGSQTVLDTCVETGDPAFCGRVHRDDQGSLWLTEQGYVDNRSANIGVLKTNGLDVGVNVGQPLRKWGKATVDFQGSWTHRHVVDNGGLATPYDCAGRYGIVCGFPLPNWRHNARLTWDPGSMLSLSLVWRHIGAVRVDTIIADMDYTPAVARITAQDYFDTTAIVRFRDRIQLRLGVRNVLDREPPVIASGNAGACIATTCNGNTFPELYDPLGRYIFAGITFGF